MSEVASARALVADLGAFAEWVPTPRGFEVPLFSMPRATRQ